MATQKINKEWTETEKFPEALTTFENLLSEGKAKRFIVGTEQQIEEEKKNINIEEEIKVLGERIEILEQKENSNIIIPSKKQIDEMGLSNR